MQPGQQPGQHGRQQPAEHPRRRGDQEQLASSHAPRVTETTPPPAAAAPLAPRRSTRTRSRNQRLQVRWGTCSYSDTARIVRSDVTGVYAYDTRKI